MQCLRNLIQKVELPSIETKALNQLIFDEVLHVSGCDSKEFYAAVYQRLISRDQGPRLPGFLKEIGKEKVLELI